MRANRDKIDLDVNFDVMTGNLIKFNYLDIKFNENLIDNSFFKNIFKDRITNEEYLKNKPKQKKIFKIIKKKKSNKILKIVNHKLIKIKIKRINSEGNSINNSNKKSKLSTRYLEDDENSKEYIKNTNSLITISKEVLDFIKSKCKVSVENVIFI